MSQRAIDYAAAARDDVVAAMVAAGMDPAGLEVQAVVTAADAAGQVTGTTPDDIDAADTRLDLDAAAAAAATGAAGEGPATAAVLARG